MTSMLHERPDTNPFERRRQLGELNAVVSSPTRFCIPGRGLHWMASRIAMTDSRQRALVPHAAGRDRGGRIGSPAPFRTTGEERVVPKTPLRGGFRQQLGSFLADLLLSNGVLLTLDGVEFAEGLTELTVCDLVILDVEGVEDRLVE
jgi:hypothetical protein